jgi:hypothetical protein
MPIDFAVPPDVADLAGPLATNCAAPDERSMQYVQVRLGPARLTHCWTVARRAIRNHRETS